MEQREALAWEGKKYKTWVTSFIGLQWRPVPWATSHTKAEARSRIHGVPSPSPLLAHLVPEI